MCRRAYHHGRRLMAQICWAQGVSLFHEDASKVRLTPFEPTTHRVGSEVAPRSSRQIVCRDCPTGVHRTCGGTLSSLPALAGSGAGSSKPNQGVVGTDH
jgi:hypothetical protein